MLGPETDPSELVARMTDPGTRPSLFFYEVELARSLAGGFRPALDAALAAPDTRTLALAALGQGGDGMCPHCENLVTPIKPTRLQTVLTPPGERPARQEDEAARSRVGPSLQGLSVLVVEDNPINQTFARLLLRKLGCNVTMAANGQEGLVASRRDTYDVILTDVQMPLMDGLEMTRRIRRDEAVAGRHLPIIGVTAHALSSDMDRCLDAGMDGYVPKPIDSEHLCAVLADLLPGTVDAT